VKTARIKVSMVVMLLCASGHSGFAQGFINLNCEEATIAPTSVGSSTYPADPTQCFPGWTGGGSSTVVMFNDLSLGSPAVSLMGPDFPNGAGYTPLQGSYSVLLQYFGSDGPPPTLSQTGFVPVGTQSISFLVSARQSAPDATAALVTLNGVNIPLVPIAGNLVAGNVSAYAGGMAQLTISTLNSPDLLYFDNIQFSASPDPKPNSFELFALGGLLVAWLHWRKPLF
jgi:hypothetical protein